MRHEGNGEDLIFWWCWHPTEVRGQYFGHEEGAPPFSPLVGNSDPPYKEYPDKCAWSAYCNGLKRLLEGIFFQGMKFTAGKVKDG